MKLSAWQESKTEWTVYNGSKSIGTVERPDQVWIIRGDTQSRGFLTPWGAACAVAEISEIKERAYTLVKGQTYRVVAASQEAVGEIMEQGEWAIAGEIAPIAAYS